MDGKTRKHQESTSPGKDAHDFRPAGKPEANYSKVLKAHYEIKAIRRILQDPGKWLELGRLRNPKGDPHEAFSALLKRKKELEDSIDRNFGLERPGQSIGLSQSRALPPNRRMLMNAMSASMSEQYDRFSSSPSRPNIGVIVDRMLARYQLQQPQCPLLMLGEVQASDFAQYVWLTGDPDVDFGGIAFWPLSAQPQQIPGETIFEGWVGDTGGHFWGDISVGGSLWPLMDPFGVMASAAVLQFTFPAPPCDVVLAWGTRAIADAPAEWFFDAEYGRIDTDWFVNQSPGGDPFPWPLTTHFQDFANGLDQSTDHPDLNVLHTEFPLSGGFEVKAGVAAKVYLGCSLMLAAQDGFISTIPFGGVGERFEFKYGVFYIMATPESA